MDHDLTAEEYDDVIGLLSDTGDPEWRPIVDKLRAHRAVRGAQERLEAAISAATPGAAIRAAGPLREHIARMLAEGHVELAPSAVAGLREIQTGDAGVPVIRLTEHEVVDLVLSGSAFTLDGQYKLVDEDGELRPLAAVWTASGRLR